jgi:hypothetical protein
MKSSYVLPITQKHFNALLARIQNQSNMVVRLEEPKWTIQKVADEGTKSPFIARVFMGILKLRDAVNPDPAQRAKFDESYEVVLSALQTARKSAQNIVQLWQEHCRKITSGEVARLQGQMIHIDESIDAELRKEVESFVIAAGRTLKEGVQKVAAEAQIDVGFLFQKQSAFDARAVALEKTDCPLANYFRQTRAWSERLQQSRNDIEHKGWILPRVTYSRQGNMVTPAEPSIAGQHVGEFVKFMLDRVICFVEELAAHCLQKQMHPLITITEIPFVQRLEEAPERFRVTPSIGGEPAWEIAHHNSSFEET